jgi:hypothetical protein
MFYSTRTADGLSLSTTTRELLYSRERERALRKQRKVCFGGQFKATLRE